MTQEARPPRLGRGIFICLIAYLFFITASSLVSTFRREVPIVQIVFIQNIVSFLCTLPFCLKQGWRALKTTYLKDHLIRDSFGIGSYYCYFLAIRYLELVDAATLSYTAPLFVPFIWRFWKKQKVGNEVWWAIIVGFFGVTLILKPSQAIFQPGLALGLIAGIFSAVAFCAIRVLTLHQEPARRTLFYYFLFGIFVTFPFNLFGEWQPLEALEWLDAFIIGIATAFGQLLLTVAYRYGTAAYLTPLGYSTVVYAGFIGWFFLGQTFTLNKWIGTLLIVLGGTATYVLKKKPKTFTATFEKPKD